MRAEIEYTNKIHQLCVNEKKILNDISVEITGKHNNIGPNGSEKSTLLKVISGDFEYISTKVFYDGVPLSQFR